MLSTQLVLVLLILAAPIYALLAFTFALPPYLLLLGVGLGLLYLCWQSRPDFEEVFFLSMAVVGVCCTIAGLAIAPLMVQVAAAIGLLTVYGRYPVEV